MTSVVVTHEMDSAFRIADRMIMLHRGRVLKIGPKAEFEALRDAAPSALASDDDRLINEFLNGRTHGRAAEGESELSRLLIGPGERRRAR